MSFASVEWSGELMQRMKHIGDCMELASNIWYQLKSNVFFLICKNTKNKLLSTRICFMLVPVSNVVLLYPVLHLNSYQPFLHILDNFQKTYLT